MNAVLFSVENAIAFITLNRPEKYNAFNRGMALALQEALDKCATDKDIRCVYLTGAGKAFCAGQDLEEVLDPNGAGMNRILREHFNPIILKIQQLQKPVIAAVNGVAAGAGANIALACDVVVATESAAFIQAFSKIGLIPDSGGTFTLPRLIGLQKASAIMLLGDKIMAEEAERLGMIYKWFPGNAFESSAKLMAATLAALPVIALALTKQALQLSAVQSLEQQLETEDKFQQLAAASMDFKEGVQAFTKKKTAVFRQINAGRL